MSDQMKDECPTCGGLPPGEASGAGDLCYCTPDDASREAAKRMSVRGPSGTSSAEQMIAALRGELAQAQRERDELKRQWGDPTPELAALRAAEHQLWVLRAALQAIVAEMTKLLKTWRGHAKTNRIDARDERNPVAGQVAAAIHEACIDELTPLRDRLAALGGPQE